jgi:hypothetical protein
MMDFFNIIKDAVIQLVKRGEDNVLITFYRIKRSLFRMLVELIILGIAIIFTLVGITLILGNYFKLEWVMFLVGLLLLNVSLFMTKFRH